MHGETLLRVHVLSVFPFHKSIIELVMGSERVCPMEVLLVVLVCMMLIFWLRVELGLWFCGALLWLGGTNSPSIFPTLSSSR